MCLVESTKTKTQVSCYQSSWYCFKTPPPPINQPRREFAALEGAGCLYFSALETSGGAAAAVASSLAKGCGEDLGVSQNYGYPFGGPHNKDYSILGSLLGSPYFGKLPFEVRSLNFKVQGTVSKVCCQLLASSRGLLGPNTMMQNVHY